MLQADEYFFAPALFRQGLKRQPGEAGCSDGPAGSGDQRKPAESRWRNCDLQDG